jgi:hypothetical protein
MGVAPQYAVDDYLVFARSARLGHSKQSKAELRKCRGFWTRMRFGSSSLEGLCQAPLMIRVEVFSAVAAQPP